MTKTHVALIAGFLASASVAMGNLDHWADLTNIKVVAGFIGMFATALGALYSNKPGAE